MVFCGFFSELTKRNSSSKRNRTNASPVKLVRTNMGSKYSADLSTYISACKEDSNLESFDSSLHQRTNKVIRDLAAQAETQSLSLDSLMEVYGYLLELSKYTVTFIVETKEDVWKNKDLKSIVDVYFKSTTKTLDFFNTVQNYVKRTEISQLIIQLAVKKFERESVDTEVKEDKKKRYAKTLEELYKFKAMGDPFGDEFVTQYNLVYEQQIQLLQEFHKLRVKLNKKLRNVKIWRTLANIVFATAFVSVLVLSVVLAAMVAPPVVTAVASSLTAPIDFVGKWCSQMWKDYEKALKRQRHLVSSIEKPARINNEATQTIRILVENLKIRISSILETVEIVVVNDEDEVAMSLAMQEIKNKVEGFTEKIRELGSNAEKCSKYITLGRLAVMKHIVEAPNIQSEVV